MAEVSELAASFRDFSGSATARAPLYSRLSASIADDEQIVSLLTAAPEPQQIPVLLFAAVHYAVLTDPASELAAFYPNLTAHPMTGDPFPAFRRFVDLHKDELRATIAGRTTQTNEVGRCAHFLLPMAMVADECGPVTMIDVGTSAGLNLLLPRYSYDYEPGGSVLSVTGDRSAVHLTCATRGTPPVPARVPDIVTAIGLDRSPIDVADDAAVRWLEACVWPDQADRFERLVAAIALARSDPPDVRTGDAVHDLAALVRDAQTHGHPVVTNSWVLNYLTHDDRLAYVAALDGIGAEADLSWIVAESPARTVGLPIPTSATPEHLTVLSLIRWRNGQRTVQRLATTHPHGFWLHWERTQRAE